MEVIGFEVAITQNFLFVFVTKKIQQDATK
jgi:hypothetical protein